MRDGLEFLGGHLEIPIGGKTYSVSPCSIGLGMRLRATAEGKPDEDLANMPASESYALILGAAFGQMVTDNIAQVLVKRAYLAAMAWHQTGSVEFAEQVWDAGSVPEYLASLEEAATKLKNASGTAKGARTRSRGSSSGTSSRRASPSAASREAPRSRGRTSSSNGD